MELHRNWRVYTAGPVSLGFAMVCALVPWWMGLLGYALRLGDWLAYLGAVVFLVGGVLQVRDSRQPSCVRIDSAGITRSHGDKCLRLGWSRILRIGFEKPADGGRFAKPTQLTVWTNESVTAEVEPEVSLPGLRGYHIADTRQVVEPRTQIEAALRKYAGTRYSEAPR